MAGHSKWANIRYRKGVQDARRGTDLHQADPRYHHRCAPGRPPAKPVFARGLGQGIRRHMTRDTIERATKRGTGELAGEKRPS